MKRFDVTNDPNIIIRVRVIRERLSATPGHVIGQGPAPGGGVVPCGGGGGRGECTFLRVFGLVLKLLYIKLYNMVLCYVFYTRI